MKRDLRWVPAAIAWLALGSVVHAQAAAAGPNEAAAIHENAGDRVPAIAFRDLGYHAALMLQGANAAASIGVALPTYGIRRGTLSLVLLPAAALDDGSTVRAFADDRLLGSTTVKALRLDPEWKLSVPPTSRQAITVRLETALFVSGGGGCDAQPSANLWLAVDPASTLTYVAAPGMESVADFFRFPGGRIVLDAAWTTPQEQAAAIAVFAAARRLIGHTPTDLTIAARDGERAAVASDKPERRLVVATSGAPLRRDGSTLYVGASQDTLRLLTRDAGGPSLLGGGVSAVQSAARAERPSSCGPGRLCLSDLGAGDLSVSGTGSMSTAFGFTLAAFGGWPSDLAFDLDAAFDKVPADTLERAVARVRLNGALLETIDLRGRSTLQQSIPLPAPLLDVANRLEVELFYAPVSGHCEGSTYAMSAQVRRTSALTWSSLAGSRGRLGEAVAGSDGQVVLTFAGAPPALARMAARVLAALSEYSGTPLVPLLDQPRGKLPGTPMEFVIGSSVPATIPAHLLLTRDLEVVSAASGAPVLHASPDTPLVSLEYLPERRMLVLQSSRRAEPGLMASAFADVLDEGRWLGTRGNTIVSNGDETVTLDLAGGSLAVRAGDRAATTWAAARWLIFAAGSVLVIVPLVALYQRLGRRPPLPPHPSHAR